MRALSPELLVTAKTQRWKPEEFLRTLVEAEIASRDASNAANRLKAAAFPVTKTLDEFDVVASSVKQTTFDYLSSLEWVRAKENLCLVGPAGTGKSHLLVALGHARHRSRLSGPLLQRRGAGRDPLSGTGRQLGRPGARGDPQSRPDPDRRDRLRADGPHRSPALLPPRRRRPTSAGPSASPRTGPSRTGVASCPSSRRPSACSTGCSTTTCSSSPRASRSA